MSQRLPRLRDLSDSDRLFHKRLDAFLEEHKEPEPPALKRKRRKRPPLPQELRQLIIDRDGPHCYMCGLKCYEHEIHIDHVIPRARGGSDDPSNLKVSCWLCNLRKGAKTTARSAPVRVKIKGGRVVSGQPLSPHKILAEENKKLRRHGKTTEIW